MTWQSRATMMDDPTRTVVLIGDDAAVGQRIHALLETSCYNLVEASTEADALLIAELHRGDIDVIVTDVAGPRVKLVRALLKLRPGVRILHVSEYPELSAEDHLAACDEIVEAIKAAVRQVPRRRGTIKGGIWRPSRLISTLAAGAS